MNSLDDKIQWNDRPIVWVDATVMERGEDGWSPHLGNGHSKVAIYESTSGSHYKLHAYRSQDRVVTLDSFIPIGMPFHRGNDIFQHWKIGEKRLGLAFNGTADARSFDRGIRVALENLEKASRQQLQHTISSSGSSDDRIYDDGVPDTPTSNITLERPLERPHPNTSMTSSTSLNHSTMFTSRCLETPVPVLTNHEDCLTSSDPEERALPGHAIRVTSPPMSSHRAPPAVLDKVTIIKETSSAMTSSKPTSSTRSNRRTRTRHIAGNSGGSSCGRIRLNKPPTLSKLDQKRDLYPTKFNSYVQMNDPKSPNSASSGGNIRTLQPHHHAAAYGRPRVPGVSQGYTGSIHPADYRFYLGNKTVDSVSDPMLLNTVAPPKHNLQRSTKGSKRDFGERLRCRHCQSYYNQDRNRPGSCPDAPIDPWKKFFRRISCLVCADAVLYHGCQDEEGNYPRVSCSCRDSYDSSQSLPRRWLSLILLSIFIPCLCLYPLLAACHKCGVTCQCCGGRHEPLTQLSKAKRTG